MYFQMFLGRHLVVASNKQLNHCYFLIENHELSIGDKVLISGPTTGEQEFLITEFLVDGNAPEIAKAGDQITFELPFRVRLSDKLYKILTDK